MLLMPAMGPWAGGGRVNVVNSGMRAGGGRVKVNVVNVCSLGPQPPLPLSRFTVSLADTLSARKPENIKSG